MKRIFPPLASLLIILSMLACATIGSPPGGPKDETPPIAIKSKPANFATNYDRKNIAITFDEFVTLDNVYTEFTISPPLEKNPVPRLRGKEVVIDLPAEELDSATYTLDFGQSIADNNEGNLLPNFQFVISKQAYIDSFSVSGIVLDAYTKKADETGFFIQLYNNLADSAPKTINPSYIGKTTPTGKFRINHIAPGTYTLIALQDANTNMLFDMPSEQIAFLDEPVYLYADSFPEPAELEETIVDSLAIKKIKEPKRKPRSKPKKGNSLHTPIADSTQSDSTQTDSIEVMKYGYAVNLYSFTEDQTINQYVVEYDRSEPEKFQIIMAKPNDTSLSFRLLQPKINEDWYLQESNKIFDTLVFWLPDSNLIMYDSLMLAVSYLVTDSTENIIREFDTLFLDSPLKAIVEEDPKKKLRKKDRGLKLPFGQKEETDSIKIEIPRASYIDNINTSAQDLYQAIIITPETPVFDYLPDLIEVYRLEDTLEIVEKFVLLTDSSDIRRMAIQINFEPYTDYIVKLAEGVFTDIYGQTIDSTEFHFTTQRDDYYGIVQLGMVNIQQPTILQLLTKEEGLVKQKILYADEQVRFDFLKPGSYLLKVIYDDNDNGKWDTGEYNLKLQPEKVFYYSDELDVRSNWTIDNTWELK